MSKIITVENISKKYSIGSNQNTYSSLRDGVVNLFTHPIKTLKNDKSIFWALKDINFTLEKGDTLGIIGANGAGKSTLLKILSRVTTPTTGEIILKGRVSSLLEVGTGFHPELTGRENIFLNGSVMGLSKKEINEKFSSIATFSGIEKFLDTPIKYYSTGMYTRLAFSIAAYLDPEIMIVDEVLAVGDLSFQKKSLDKINEVGERGKTVIFVSHNMAAVAKICRKVLWLEKGKIVEIGPSNKVISNYIARMDVGSQNNQDLTDKKIYKHKIGYESFQFTSIEVKPETENKKQIYFKEPFQIKIEGVALKNLNDFTVGFGVASPTGISLFNTYSLDSQLSTVYKKGKIKFKIDFNPNILVPGSYKIDLVALGEGVSEWIPEAIQFEILAISNEKNDRLNDGVITYPVLWREEDI